MKCPTCGKEYTDEDMAKDEGKIQCRSEPNTKGLKIEVGMILVYTPKEELSNKEALVAQTMLEREVRNALSEKLRYRSALSVDSKTPLPVGIVITQPGDKLELVREKE